MIVDSDEELRRGMVLLCAHQSLSTLSTVEDRDLYHSVDQGVSLRHNLVINLAFISCISCISCSRIALIAILGKLEAGAKKQGTGTTLHLAVT